MGGAAARQPPPLGAPLNKAVNVVDYYSDTNLYANTVKPMLATFGSIKSRPDYPSGQLTETTSQCEN